MSNYLIKGETLTSIADAIRAKNGSSNVYNTVEMAAAISEIKTGVEFNIAYGDTPPEDKSKLWVNVAGALDVQITSKAVHLTEILESDIATLPTAAYNMASAVVGNKVYLFGGLDGNARLDTINVFDVETNTVTTLDTKLPTAARSITAAVVGSKIYLFGGHDGAYMDTINVFDVETNTVTTLDTKLPTAARSITAVVVGSKIYLFGGFVAGNSYLKDINVFDVETYTVTTLDVTLVRHVCGAATMVIGTKVYLLGDELLSYGYIQVFDTENHTCDLGKPVPIQNYADFAFGGTGAKLYTFGGRGGSPALNVMNTIMVYNAESDKYTTLDLTLPAATSSITSAVVGNKVYLFGGVVDGDAALMDRVINTISVFTMVPAIAANSVLIETTTDNNLFDILPMLEIGVNNVYLGNSEGYAEKVPAYLYKDGAWTEI